jgi:hypothetical protein
VITLFEGEQRNGRIKLTDDRDCLAPDIIRLALRAFATKRDIMDAVRALETRHFCVCLDTADMFYETSRRRP